MLKAIVVSIRDVSTKVVFLNLTTLVFNIPGMYPFECGSLFLIRYDSFMPAIFPC